MSEKSRNSRKSFEIPDLNVIPYETSIDESLEGSLLEHSFEDSVFAEPDTEENLKTALARSGKRFEFGTGLSNIRADCFELRPVINALKLESDSDEEMLTQNVFLHHMSC